MDHKRAMFTGRHSKQSILINSKVVLRYYSFSIVLQEVITRSGPFETVKVVGSDGNTSVVSLDPQFITQQMRTSGSNPYRPNVEQHECTQELSELLIQCWDEVPANRPSFPSIKQQLKKITKFVDISGAKFASF